MKEIIVITGPTAVGKTKLSISLAHQLNGEIINADSTQIYIGLDIATAKVTEDEMDNIPHHLLDIKELEDDYTAYQYQVDCRLKIKEILDRGKVPIIVGGTGLYIKAALYDYNFSTLKSENNEDNKLLYDVIFIGLTTNRELLYGKINDRVDIMIENGLLEEAELIYKKNIRSKAVMTPIGYKELFDYFNGEQELNEVINLIKQRSRNYAKRQYTWFNNKMDINWFDVDYNNFNNTINKVKEFIENEKTNCNISL